MTIPGTPTDITAEWFNEHLGWDVSGVQIHEIGAGIGVSSAVYRAHLIGTDVPETVVVKTHSNRFERSVHQHGAAHVQP